MTLYTENGYIEGGYWQEDPPNEPYGGEYRPATLLDYANVVAHRASLEPTCRKGCCGVEPEGVGPFGF